MQTFSGLDYIKIDIGNQMGYDKLLWDERIDWVDANMNHLHALVNKADKPILYAKALRALHDAQAGNPTGFIMGLDACSSGIQIMSTLHGCHTGSKSCGIVNTGNREDFYTNVVLEMNKILPKNKQILL